MYLKKGDRFDRRDEAGMAGLAVLRKEGRTVIAKIYTGGPSEKAGLKVGDVILEIMGKSIDFYEICEIGRLLRSGDKRKIDMTVRRGEEKKRVTIELRKRI